MKPLISAATSAAERRSGTETGKGDDLRTATTDGSGVVLRVICSGGSPSDERWRIACNNIAVEMMVTFGGRCTCATDATRGAVDRMALRFADRIMFEGTLIIQSKPRGKPSPGPHKITTTAGTLVRWLLLLLVILWC